MARPPPALPLAAHASASERETAGPVPCRPGPSTPERALAVLSLWATPPPLPRRINYGSLVSYTLRGGKFNKSL